MIRLIIYVIWYLIVLGMVLHIEHQYKIAPYQV